VALGIAEAELVADPSHHAWRARVPLPAVGGRVAAGAERRAVAAWVTRPGEFTVLQAAGGWLPL
jgi:hypothetical protein